MQSPPVLIVGAGPAGLVMALSLLQNDVPVRIIEKDKAHHTGQRGAAIMPRTIELYNFLGVLPDIYKHSSPSIPMQSFEMPGGKVPLKQWRMSPVLEPTPANPWPNSTMLGQDTAERLLREHIRAFGCEVELGSQLVSLVQTEEYVEATLTKFVDGREVTETTQFKWLIGADGGRSTVRKQLGLSFLGESRKERHIIADVHVTGLDMHNLHLFGGGESGTVLIWPNERKDGDLMTVYATGPDADYDAMAKDYSVFKAYVEKKLGRPDIALGDSTWLTDYHPNIRMVDTFQQGRVFLAGDAAHVHSLTGGQGMNTSVQDSFNLGWKLALVERHLASPTLLASYTEERLPVVAEVLNITTDLFNKYVSATRERGGWVRGGKLKQLYVNYRWSSIIVDGRASAVADLVKNPYGNVMDANGGGELELLRAGDRAPDAPDLLLDNERTSLFKIFSPSWHTVLMFSSFPVSKMQSSLDKYMNRGLLRAYVVSRQAVQGDEGNQVQEIHGKLLVDTKGYAHKHYGVGPDTPTVVIVRPDGVVGAIALDDNDVVKYFSGVFAG
ncbi:monooxygenase [Lentinula guzmanii]|uniref:Monooxygenase n=4 Tax=Lentinula TaxID=5352 RepID=A0AA38MRC6_9AGAR|nr:monooxygenase [Lentinula guzmanii]KAJ3787101.1 monooxygenase [Lentinula aff. detonsa]KAJ3981691.1 monooxygenase [Lentinula detonsa]